MKQKLGEHAMKGIAVNVSITPPDQPEDPGCMWPFDESLRGYLQM